MNSLRNKLIRIILQIAAIIVIFLAIFGLFLRQNNLRFICPVPPTEAQLSLTSVVRGKQAQPIQNAKVILRFLDFPLEIIKHTDAVGVFTITDVRTYDCIRAEVYIEATGYQTCTNEVKVTEPFPQEITLLPKSPNQTTQQNGVTPRAIIRSHCWE
jgi:hypothetical protein